MKKQNFRSELLAYIQAHADGKRIPTVEELRKALGVTSYLVMRGLNELKQEGFLICRSRKNGTFLTNYPKRRVVGLMLEQGGACEYINFPAWVSGFCQVFAENETFLIRMVQQGKWSDLGKNFEKLGLDALVVVGSNEKMVNWDAGALRKKLLLNFCSMRQVPDLEEHDNIIFSDRATWKEQYVSAAIRHNCRSFLQVGAKNEVSKQFAAEIRRQNLDWDDDRLISTLDEEILSRKLPKLIRKYHFDAVRCEGPAYQEFFFSQLQKYPDFRPYIPLFGGGKLVNLLRQSPWLNAEIVMEHLGNYGFRWGKFAGELALKMVEEDSASPAMVFPMRTIGAGEVIRFPDDLIRKH